MADLSPEVRLLPEFNPSGSLAFVQLSRTGNIIDFELPPTPQVREGFDQWYLSRYKRLPGGIQMFEASEFAPPSIPTESGS